MMTWLKQNWFKATILLTITFIFPAIVWGQNVPSEQAALEKNIEILEKVNNALVQRWTPINIILSTLMVILAALAIMAGALFAWGSLILSNLRKERRRALDMAKAGEKRVNELLNNASLVVEQLKEKKKTAAEFEEDILKIKKQMEDTVDKVRDELVVSGSGSTLRASGVGFGGTAFAGGFGGINVFGSKEPDLALMKVCSKCNNVFQEDNDPFGLSTHFISANISRFGEKPLCKNCRSEK